MAVSSEPSHGSSRRARYVRQPGGTPPALTPKKRTLLRYAQDYGLASVPQLARLTGMSEKAVRLHMRPLFDAGLVAVFPVSRAALAEAAGADDPALVLGSAPNCYGITRAGIGALGDLGDEEEPPRPYGAKSSAFVAHELAVRDVRVWLELSARLHSDERLERWEIGAKAEIDLRGVRHPKIVRPDAWFVYRLGSQVLVGLVEADRGTERGGRRWPEKLEAYGALFQGGRLREVTGYVNARVLVVAPDARRRDSLAEFIAREAPPALSDRFWLAERTVLGTPGLADGRWRQPGSLVLRPLVAPGRQAGDPAKPGP